MPIIIRHIRNSVGVHQLVGNDIGLYRLVVCNEGMINGLTSVVIGIQSILQVSPNVFYLLDSVVQAAIPKEGVTEVHVDRSVSAMIVAPT